MVFEEDNKKTDSIFSSLSGALGIIIDFLFYFMEYKKFNVPKPTKDLYHILLLVIILHYFGTTIVFNYFNEIFLIFVLFILLSLAVANGTRLKELFGIYTPEKRASIIIKRLRGGELTEDDLLLEFRKNFFKRKDLAKITREIKRQDMLNTGIIKAICKQERSSITLKELVDEKMTQSEFGTVIKCYENAISNKLLERVIKNQTKMNTYMWQTLLFYQERSYNFDRLIKKKIKKEDIPKFMRIIEKYEGNRWFTKILIDNKKRKSFFSILIFSILLAIILLSIVYVADNLINTLLIIGITIIGFVLLIFIDKISRYFYFKY